MKNATKHLNEIKKNKTLHPIYLVWGTETLLTEEVVKALTSRMYQDGEDDMNIAHFDLNDTSIDDVIYEAESLPFFGEKKLIVVHSSYILTGKQAPVSIDHSLKLLESYIENPSDFSILVFVAPYEKLDKRKKVTKLLLKQAEVIDANPVTEQETSQYLSQYASREGYDLSRETLTLLLQLTDRNMTKARKELDKLMLYHSQDKRITTESIHLLVPKSLEQNIFDLNDRVLKKDVKASIELYQDLLNQKEEPIKILALMIAEFRLLLQVKILRKKGYQQADIASILKIHPYRVKLAIQKEKRFKQEVLSEAHHFLIHSDHEIKTGKAQAHLQIEMFIWRFSTLS